MNRRRLLQASATLGVPGLLGGFGLLGGCATTARTRAGAGTSSAALGSFGPSSSAAAGWPVLAPVRAQMDRVFDVTVCLRPFRAAGPRMDVETIGDTLVIHNYGHGGSGWSLSWGSGTLAVRKAMAGSPRRVAVVGCGALGLTAALLSQEAGAEVTIYARDPLPDTRSARATGSWTPDSRIALTEAAGPGFGAVWEEMARLSFHRYRRYLGLPGQPVEWSDRYILSDLSPEEQEQRRTPDPLGFAEYGERIRDLTPRPERLPVGWGPFPTPYVRRTSAMQFNIADYAHTLMADFHAAGGKLVRREFHDPAEFAALPEKVVINCPGYGARALWRDESVVPVRGQISWLIPQPEVTYGLFYNGVSMLSRRDGIVVQAVSGGDIRGYKDDHEVPDAKETAESVATLAELYARPWKRAA